MEVAERFAWLNQAVLKHRGQPLSATEIAVIQGSCSGHTYEQIAEATNYSVSYLSRTLCPQLWAMLSAVLGTTVSKKSLCSVLEQFSKLQFAQLQSSELQSSELQLSAAESQTAIAYTPSSSQAQEILKGGQSDWGEAIDVSIFYGREYELETMQSWILDDRCRLIAILGMGGIGKTALSVKLSQRLQEEFDFVIWRSLRNAPPLETLLSELVPFLSNQQETQPELSKLLHCLKVSRCLVILDNLETLLDATRVGLFQSEFEAYGELLHALGEIGHKSCVVITSREKPADIATLEGMGLAVRTVRLDGSIEAAMEILQDKGLIGTAEQKQQLSAHYGNSPLALKIVATSIQELFEGEIESFLNENTFIFNGIRRLLDQQFNRLSPLEKSVMCWLAINREWVAIADLQSDLVPPVSKQRLMETLEALSRRSLIEHNHSQFTQQPVVMEYIIDRLIEQISDILQSIEPDQTTLGVFNTHALIKATAKDYVRESQLRLILQPIADCLRELFGLSTLLKQHLLRLLDRVRQSQLQPAHYGTGNLINLMLHWQINLADYDFSHLTIRQAWLQNTLLQHVNFSSTHFIACRFAQALGNPLSMAVSADSHCVAIGVENGSIYVWQVPTGDPLLTISAHDTYIFALTFSPDGRTLISGGMDGCVKFWDTKTGNCWQTLQAEGAIWSLAFSPDGQWLAIGTGGARRLITVWNWRNQQCLKTLIGHEGQPSTLVFVPSSASEDRNRLQDDFQGVRLVSGSHDATLKVWDLDRETCLQTLSEHQGVIFAVKLHPQGDRFASASFDRTVKLWDAATGICLHTFTGHTAEVTSVSFSADGQMLASSSYDRTIRLWDTASGQCIQVLQGHLSHVWAAAFVDSCNLAKTDRAKTDRNKIEQAKTERAKTTNLVSVSWDKSVRLWPVNRRSSYCVKTIQGSYIGVRSVAFHPQGHCLASAGVGREIRLWNEIGQCIKTFQANSSGIQQLAFHPQGKMLASGGFSREIRIWDIATGRCLYDLLTESTSWVHALEFSPQGYLASSTSSDATIRLWDSQTGDCLNAITLAPDAYALGLAFHPSGHYFVTAGNDDQLRWWDTETGDCFRVVRANHGGHAWCVKFHPQGHLLASIGNNDCAVNFWDAETGRHLQASLAGSGVNGSLAFNADGSLLARARGDCYISLLEVATGRCLRTLKGHTKAVTSVNFRPINSSLPLTEQVQILASGSYDETVRLWDVQTGECLQILRPERLYEGMNISGASGLSQAQVATLEQLGAVVSAE